MTLIEPNTDTLLGIAEVAVAFVGISALVGIIGARSREKAVLDLARLKSVIYISLLVVGSALFPIVAAEFKMGYELGWRLVSIIALTLNLALLAYTIYFGNDTGLHKADKLYVWLGYGTEPLVQVMLWFNVFGVFLEHASAFYLTFLILALLQGAIAFMLLLNSLFFDAQQGGR
ncbi:MAG: hypothetical protein ACU84Q_13455 [Gammaproteobacteria bacterium]